MKRKDKKPITRKALADLFKKDIPEIATDARYMQPEQGPIPIVGDLLDVIDELEGEP